MRWAIVMVLTAGVAHAAPPLTIPDAWRTLDPRMKALLPHGTVLRVTERLRWGAITVRDYELQIAIDQVDREIDRLVAIARASELPPTFLPHGVVRMNGPGIFIDMKATPTIGSIELRYTLDAKLGAVQDELARYPRCAAIDALARRKMPRSFERTLAEGAPAKESFTAQSGEQATCND